jgi:dethiobiotin synthetase
MRWFVTGTDTNVGKTVVTACLAAAAREHGSVVACKPVASGVDPGTPGEDAALLGFAAGHPPCGFYTFAAAISPHRAGAAEGREVADEVLDQIRGLGAATVLVEGAGGWRVPIRLHPPLWVADLARATAGPVIVVAADRLGVLNHTLLTVEAIQAAGLPVAGVVLNQGAHPADLSTRSNLDDLRHLCAVPVAPLEHVDVHRVDSLRDAGRKLARAILGGTWPG